MFLSHHTKIKPNKIYHMVKQKDARRRVGRTHSNRQSPAPKRPMVHLRDLGLPASNQTVVMAQ
jgi:hypothetical protein